MEIFKRLICVFQAILLMLIGTAEEAIRYAEPFYNAESRQSGDNSLPDRGAALDEEAITGGGAEPADNARLGEGAEPEKYAGSGGDAASGADAVYSIAAAPRIPAVILDMPDSDAPEWLLDNKGREEVGELSMNDYVVFKLPRPYSHLLFQWMSSFNYNYIDTKHGGPYSYQIEISSNSTDGIDGVWILAADVKNNYVAARAHEIKGEDILWVRFRVTGGGLAIDEIDIHDLSQCEPGGAWDTWGFIGDSITAYAYWRDAAAGKPFNTWVNEQYPERSPSMINFGVGGDKAENVYARLKRTIELNEPVYFWAIGVGSNDNDAARYEQYMRDILDLLTECGKQPIIARIPYSSSLPDDRIQSLNAIVIKLTNEYGLPAGPNLYARFKRDKSCLAEDGLHPSYKGMEAMNEMWAQTALTLGKRSSRSP